MITLRSFFLTIALILSSQVLLAPEAVAKDTKAQVKISESQASRKAQKAFAGKVLKVELKGKVYRVKIYQESGRVVYVNVDATTGKIRK